MNLSVLLTSGVYGGEQRQNFTLILGNHISHLLLCCLLLHLGGKHEELKDVLVQESLCVCTLLVLRSEEPWNQLE